MKAGFERTGIASTISAWVLGTNGEEVTCILGNAPGGLELLPTKDYTQNDEGKQWLHVTLQNGKMLSLPQYDPYAEIYRIGENVNIVTQKKDATFWRLVNPNWLDPGGSGANNPYDKQKDSWGNYVKCIKKAEEFHDDLKIQCHKNTYQFYSSCLNTVDKISFTHEELKLNAYEGVALGIDYARPTTRATSRGNCVMYIDNLDQEIASPLPKKLKTTFLAFMSRINDYREGGDGTVPDSSGSALKGEEILKVSKFKRYEHQEVYQKREARDFVITAIRNLALKRIEEGIEDGSVGAAE